MVSVYLTEQPCGVSRTHRRSIACHVQVGCQPGFSLRQKGLNSHSDSTSATNTKNVELSDICLSDFLNEKWHTNYEEGKRQAMVWLMRQIKVEEQWMSVTQLALTPISVVMNVALTASLHTVSQLIPGPWKNDDPLPALAVIPTEKTRWCCSKGTCRYWNGATSCCGCKGAN